ncbi:thiol-disulfide oxidoreductase [Rosistilla carotiformis]|uniref:Thiol-disulfide oxidoreductase n=1 Tax=Rosistilla carotiformis TaxID=2528017 RepID=A0A518JQE5_9BACT|nr:TlpA disulfide reductase family protein [Rosistilla carotiformis]QDV67764.1 thiol-disulfide oxidoreductase [Rosistilla carotiformis]
MTRRLIITLVGASLLSGCSSKTDEVTSQATKYQAADAGGDKQPAGAIPPANPLVNGTPDPNGNPNSAPPLADPTAAPTVDGMLNASDPGPTGLPPLADDAPLEATLAYFEKTNEALRQLMSGQSAFTTQAAQIAEAKRISSLKLAAAEHAMAIKDIQPATLTVARRTKLEALSQLAGLQDVAAAEQLEAYATELASSDDPDLVNDSRVVRLGFELDKIRTGQSKSTDRLLALVGEFQTSDRELGMPAFFALQQSFGVLSQYDYGDAARAVRDAIATKFAGHSDPQIAASAKMMASASRFDTLDKLHASRGDGETVTAEQWQTAIDELVAQPVDVSTFQYLAGLALSLEGPAEPSVVPIVYDAIAKTFVDATDANPEIAAEAKAFLAASNNRRDAIGKPLSINYPDLAGGELDWNAFRGSIVLMPFWTTARPESLQIIPGLQELEQEFEGKVKILGVNLDDSDEELAEFRRRFRSTFPNVRNPDPATQGVRDPLATQLGLASFPFAAVVDADGNVAKVLMGRQMDLHAVISEMLQDKP